MVSFGLGLRECLKGDSTVKSDAQRHGLRGLGFPRAVQETAMAIEKSYNWLILWDYTFHKWSFLSAYNW